MNGFIIEKGFSYFTNMHIILASIKEFVSSHNWMISNYECNYYPCEKIPFEKEYAFLSGEELLKLLSENEIQFIWAVFSAFEQNISYKEILSLPIHITDGYKGFWKNPLTLQHSLSVAEIVPWDSQLALVISEKKEIIEKTKTAFPWGERLEDYNRK